MLGLGRIGWLVGTSIGSLVTAVIAIKTVEFVTSPFFTVRSRLRLKSRSSSGRGR